MDQLMHLPWWLKIALALGGLSMMWNFLQNGVPRLAAWALPFVIRAVHFTFEWLFAHPAIRLAIVKNRDRIKPFMKAVSDAIDSLIDAAVAEADKLIDAEAAEVEQEEKAPPAPTPAPEKVFLPEPSPRRYPSAGGFIFGGPKGPRPI